MVSFKSANKQRTTVKFHKIYQMNVFVIWTANTNSCSITFMSVLTVYSYSHTLMELLIIQNLYLEIKFHIYISRCKTVCHTIISRLCYPQTNSNSSKSMRRFLYRINKHFKVTYKTIKYHSRYKKEGSGNISSWQNLKPFSKYKSKF